MSNSPIGPDSAATSFHFSYRLRISRGAFLSCLSNRRCSAIRHTHLNYEHIINDMSSDPERVLALGIPRPVKMHVLPLAADLLPDPRLFDAPDVNLAAGVE